MRYPSMKEFIKNNFAVNDISVDDTFDIMTSCIEQFIMKKNLGQQKTVPRKN